MSRNFCVHIIYHTSVWNVASPTYEYCSFVHLQCLHDYTIAYSRKSYTTLQMSVDISCILLLYAITNIFYPRQFGVNLTIFLYISVLHYSLLLGIYYTRMLIYLQYMDNELISLLLHSRYKTTTTLTTRGDFYSFSNFLHLKYLPII